MNKKDFNTAFFSYEGVINRKDYAINMLILIGLFFALSLIKPEIFVLHTSLKFLAVIISFVLSLTRFVIGFSILSQIYRRIKDITYNKTTKTKEILNKVFIFIYIVPIVLFYIISFLIADIFPGIMGIIFLLLQIMFPIMILFATIISFIKGR